MVLYMCPRVAVWFSPPSPTLPPLPTLLTTRRVDVYPHATLGRPGGAKLGIVEGGGVNCLLLGSWDC